jgi:hypothetical protein
VGKQKYFLYWSLVTGHRSRQRRGGVPFWGVGDFQFPITQRYLFVDVPVFVVVRSVQ